VDVSRSEKFGQDLSDITSREATYKGLRQRVRLLKFVREYLLGRLYQLTSSLQRHVTSNSSDNSEKNISTTSSSRSCDYASQRSGARRRALAQIIGNARRLDINSPWSAETHSQDLRFHRHQQHGDLNNARGLNSNFASDRDCDSTTITRLRHRRLRRADHAAPDKS
jgi:hypothetical protein